MVEKTEKKKKKKLCITIFGEMKVLLVLFALQIVVFAVVSSEGYQIIQDDIPSSALFVFGDSLLDPGNNNYIKTIGNFRSNFTPYGETFFNFPTGRFCDGRIIPDFIAEYAKLPLIPPYLDPDNNQYINGVNFASGGSGALPDTFPGLAIGLHSQVNYFKNVEKSLRKELGDIRAEKLISNSVYLFSFGGNDYLAPFNPATAGDQNYTQTERVNLVIGNMTSAIKELYESGGRKFAFISTSPLGCLPNSRLMNGDENGSCLEEASSLSKLNNKLMPIALNKLAIQLKGLKYTIADSYTMLLQRMDNPSKYGLKEGKTACCGSGRFRGMYSCGGKRQIVEFELCENPNDYLFFDSFHLTEKAYEQFAKLMWSGDSQAIKPYNLKQLFEYQPLLASE